MQKGSAKGRLNVVPNKSLTKWQKYVKNFAESEGMLNLFCIYYECFIIITTDR